MQQAASTCEFCGGPVRDGLDGVIAACAACVDLIAAGDEDQLAERALDCLRARYPAYRYLNEGELVEVLAVLKARHIRALKSLHVSPAERSDRASPN